MIQNPFRIPRIAALSLVSTLVLCSCATADTSLSEVKNFNAYRVYYAGDKVAGLSLEAIEGGESQSDQRSRGWAFFYGQCTPGPASEGSCAPPLQIQNYSTCRRWAAAYPGKPRLFDFRGAKAAWVPSAGSLEIYTGRTTIVIFADQRNVAISTGRALRNVHEERPSRLRPPVPGSLWGSLPCQQKPG
jgi:hypothetical protein